jgi:hypothetical protein
MPRPKEVLATANNMSIVRQLYDECRNRKNFAIAETLIAQTFQAPGGILPLTRRPTRHR